jgi:hypothetical protein
MSTNRKITVTFLMLIAGVIGTSPANAGDKDRIDRWSGYGRQGVGAIYGAVGSRACMARGPVASAGCGAAARRGGEYIYDRSREFSVREGARLQEFGRRTRERFTHSH